MDDFETALQGLRQALVDLDGDGVPDVPQDISLSDPRARAQLGLGSRYQLPDDQIALARMSGTAASAGPPSMEDPEARNAMGLLDPQRQEFANLRRSGNAMMTPFTPPGPEQREQSWGEWANDPSFNEGRGRYGLVPSVVRGASRVMNAIPDGVTNNAMTKYAGRSLEALGRAPGDIMDMSPGEMASRALSAGAFAAGMGPGSLAPAGVVVGNAMKSPEVTRGAVTGNWEPIRQAARARETAIKQAPPHTLQERNAMGRFQKFDKETREIRDAAIRERAAKREFEKGAPARRAADEARMERQRLRDKEMSDLRLKKYGYR